MITAEDVGVYKASLIKNLQSTYAKLDVTKAKVQSEYKDYYDQNKKTVNFAIGDSVMLHVPAPKPNQCYKLTPHWEGPYTVANQVNDVTFKLTMCKRNRLTNVNAHVDRMRLYKKWTTDRAEPDTPSE